MSKSKDFLDKKVTPLMEPLMIELLRNKPEDPIHFMMKYFKKFLKAIPKVK